MTKLEAQEYASRYKTVNEFEISELRSTSVEVKLEQTAALMAAVVQMGWTQALVDGEAEVRERWIRLRKAYGFG